MIALGLGIVIACGVCGLLLIYDALARANRRRKRASTRWLRDQQTDRARRALRVHLVGDDQLPNPLGDGAQTVVARATVEGEPLPPCCRSVSGDPSAQPTEVIR